MQPTGTTSILRKMPLAGSPKGMYFYVGAAVVVVILGVLTGWKLSGTGYRGSDGPVAPGAKSQENEAGIADESTFKDTATGKLEEGGIKGEGTHHLTREGGEMQQIALTSTVIDLDSFVGKQVQIWGQTLAAQKAYWLMDVGKLKVVQ